MLKFILVIIVSFLVTQLASGAPQAPRRVNDISDDIVSRLAIPDGAFCDKRVPAFLVLENYRIKSTTSLPFRNMSENSCAQMCSDNKDKHEKALLCSSFTYEKKNRTCNIHRQKAKPSGQLELLEDDKYRYYEKFCLPVYAPLDCGEALFFRGEMAVLEGAALNATKAKSLESCIHSCIQKNDDCKSAMYFEEAGECIMNSGSAQELGDSFKEESKEKVVYFENGCILGNQVRSQAKGTDSPRRTTTTESANSPLDGALAIDRAIEELERQQEGDEEVTTVKPTFSTWGSWNECDRPDGRRTRKRTCTGSEAACKHKLIESQWCDEAFASTVETASTSEGASTTGIPSTSEDPSTTEEPSTTEDPSTIEETTTESSTITTTKRKRTTTTEKLSVEEEDSTESPKAFFGLLFTPPAIIQKSSGAWGPWSRVCQPFGERQPCVEGHIVGFQNRQCLKSPSECHGPFSRYCFLPCQNQGQPFV